MPVQCPHCHSTIVFDGAAPREAVCTSCGSSVQIEPDATIDHLPEEAPKRLGRFEFLEKLGTGSFGVVYKARDTELDRLVAVKIPRRDSLPQSQDMDRFLREAKSAAHLKHPGIVSLYDAGFIEGTCCLVSEFIQGSTLSERLSAKRFSFHSAAAMIVEVADALHYAHGQGVVHRDIKPSNIMLDLDNRPHLMDFGLAKRSTDENSMTLEGQVLGTPAYMAPEQARGEVSHVDPRSDIYSLGVILYELLTGELPFHGQMRMLLVQVMQDEPRPPRRLNDRIPRDLETICLKAMSKEPAGRYQTAQNLADDLRRYMKGEPIVARPLGRIARTWRWCRRNPTVAGLTAAVAFLLVAGTTIATYFAIAATIARNRADAEALNANNKSKEAVENAQKAAEERNNALVEKARADREADDARANLYVVRMNSVQMAIDNANLPMARDLLEMLRQPGPGRKEAPNWEWHYHWRLCHNELRTLLGHSDDISCVAYSPDGTLLASASDDGTVRRWDPATGRELSSLVLKKSMLPCLAFSPDGTRLAVAAEGSNVCVLDVARWQELRTLKGHAKVVRGLAFSPDGARLFTVSEDRNLKIWDVNTGHELRTVSYPRGYLRCVAVSPDGKWLVLGGADSKLGIADATSGEEVRTLAGHIGGTYSIAFSPDGRQLALGGKDRTIRIWEFADGMELHSLIGHTSAVRSVAFSPDGAWLASAGQDDLVKVWDVLRGRELTTLRGHTETVYSVAFSPDGCRLASASSDVKIKLWDIGGNAEPRVYQGHSDQIRAVAFSPDGRRLASIGLDGRIIMRDAITGQALPIFEKPGTGLLGLAFSPDSRLLATAGDAGMVTVWDAETGGVRWTMKGHTSWLSSMAFSPDGRWLASGSHDKTIKLWDASSGQELRILYGHKGEVKTLAFSPDSKRLMSGSEDETVKVWDPATGGDLQTLSGHTGSVNSIALNRNGQLLASASADRTIKLWDLTTGQELRTLKGHHDTVWSVSFSPDGARLATAGWDKSVRIWDPATGFELTTLKGHTDRVLGVAFSPDGGRLASAGGKDLSVRVWDGRPLNSETEAERDALGLLDYLAARPLRQGDVIDYLRNAPSLAASDRHKTLALAERYPSETDPKKFYDSVWPVIRHPYANVFMSRFALAQAKAAFRLAPDNPQYALAVGIAQYRNGTLQKALYSEALATLNKCDRNQPTTLLFLAMTHWRLGDKEKASAWFDKAVQEMPKEAKDNSDLKRFRDETAALIEVK